MSSTNISKLALYYCDGESSSPLPLSSITHYSIAAAVASEVYDPLKYLILPQLSSLDIARGPGYEDEDWEDCDEKPIRDFLKRSGCAVTSLSLRAVPISDEQLIKLLWSMPTLSSLRIEEFFNNQDVITNRTVTRRFLQELTIDDTSSPLLPKLTEIFLVLREDGLADTVLPNALISRWVPDGSPSEVACIKTVDIAFVDKSEQTIEDLTLKLRFLNKRRVWVNVQRVQVVATNEPGTQYELYH
ncbi:hypothetical protein MPER_06540 [Moniliophthora perniciosa FA553]|nr:hypothetical protein MPER_06540 [Moniliophthora perniciosa FA553]